MGDDGPDSADVDEEATDDASPTAPAGAGSGDDPGASAPGLGVADDDHSLAEAPEPNEPA